MMMLHEALEDRRIAWYVIRPPHTACFMGEDGERTRISGRVLQRPIVEGGAGPSAGRFPIGSPAAMADVVERDVDWYRKSGRGVL